MAPTFQEGVRVRFGPFELDLGTGELWKERRLVRVQPQPLKVLSILVLRQGRLVDRQEMRERIWGEARYIDFERALNYCVRKVREALGDEVQNPRFIQTIPRKGYRFIAPVERVESTPVKTENQEIARPGLSGRAPVLVVLPFDNLGGDRQCSGFCHGLVEEMISELVRSECNRFGVVARTSSKVFKAVAAGSATRSSDLMVDYCIEGSVRRDGDCIRVVARLFRACDYILIATEVYEFTSAVTFIAQEEAARKILRDVLRPLREDHGGGV